MSRAVVDAKEFSHAMSKISKILKKCAIPILEEVCLRIQNTLFSQLGMNMTTAFNIFLRQSVREGCIPFDITINTPNSDTVAAILETEHMLNNPNLKTYDVEDALKELKS